MHAAGRTDAMPVPRSRPIATCVARTGGAGHLALPAHLRWGASAMPENRARVGLPARLRWGGSVMTETVRASGAPCRSDASRE